MLKLLNIFILLLIMALICPASLPVQASTESDNRLLQYTGGGHVLGFSEGGFYAATGGHALKVEFVNGLAVQPVAKSAGYGQSAAPLDKVTYNGIWKDTDIDYTSAADGIAENTYYLNTPASVESIRLRYNRPVSLDGQGNLVISFENGNMVESAPVAWQEAAGQRTPVQANFVIYDGQEVGFALDGCRPGVAVTIDPTLTWNTFLGSSNQDEGNAIAVDTAGNIYVTGTSDATWGSSPILDYSSRDDAFVAKLNSNGVLQWNTFLGGTGNDLGNDIKLDGIGNICVAGTSDEAWGESPVMKYLDGCNAFAAKLNNNGILLWNSFLGSDYDFGQGIAADAAGNVYVTGYSFATWGPSPVRQFSLGHPPDAFAAKLDGSGNLTWNTFLGGTGSDFAHGITTDSAQNVYIAGSSDATWGESPRRPFTPSGHWEDCFAVKLDRSGILQWNTFLGGIDFCSSIAVDTAGNSYVAGVSDIAWGDHPVQPYTANNDGFAAKLDGSGNLTWNTFLGGSGDDDVNGVAVDASGIYIAGGSNATWGSPVRPFTAGTDGFAARLTDAGSLSWNTFLGGSGDDVGKGVAVDAGGNVCVAGISDATWGSPVRAFTYGMSPPPEPHPTSDAFVARILGTPPSITSFYPITGVSGTVVTITGNYFLGATAVSFGGTAATGFTVNSDTQITATAGSGTTGKIAVTTPSGAGTSAADFTFASLIGTTRPHGSSMPGLTAALPQSPVILPTVSVRSASLSATKVGPGTAITVTADVVNTSTVNGSSSIKVYVNGELENSRGITVNSGSSMPITFTVSRNEPGTYSVYVGGKQAGSFTVDRFADPNMILYISGALILLAFVTGVIYVFSRRQPGR
jgi:hypothetical protein